MAETAVTVQQPGLIEGQNVMDYTRATLALLVEAQRLEVTSATTYTQALEQKRMARARRQASERYHTPLKQNIDVLKKQILEQQRAIEAPCTMIETLAERKALAWKAAEDEKQRQTQLALQAAAQVIAEDEAIDFAAAQELAGDHEAAAAAIAEVPIAPVYVDSVVPTVAGVPVKKTLHVAVVDMQALVLSIAAARMLDLLEVPGSEDSAPIVAFLRQFQPTRYDTFQPVRTEPRSKKDPRLEVVGAGALDANLPWLRGEAKQRGEAFALPGVVRSMDEGLG